MLKLFYRYYKKLCLKSTSTFEQQTGITLKLIIEKPWCCQMRHRFQHFLKYLVQSDPKSTNKALILEKNTQTQSICNQISFGNKLRKFPQKATGKNFNLKRKTQWEKNRSNNGGNYIYQYNEVKEKLHPVSIVYVWKTLEHQVKDKYAFRKIQFFFWSSPARNTLQACARHQQANTLTSSINISKHNK